MFVNKYNNTVIDLTDADKNTFQIGNNNLLYCSYGQNRSKAKK